MCNSCLWGTNKRRGGDIEEARSEACSQQSYEKERFSGVCSDLTSPTFCLLEETSNYERQKSATNAGVALSKPLMSMESVSFGSAMVNSVGHTACTIDRTLLPHLSR